MSDKKAYPLRISEPVLLALQRWAADDLRSVNAQIEYVLREALVRNGRLRSGKAEPVDDDSTDKPRKAPGER
jgi:hypothetical protein